MYKASIYIYIGSNFIEASLKGSSAFLENVAMLWTKSFQKIILQYLLEMCRNWLLNYKISISVEIINNIT